MNKRNLLTLGDEFMEYCRLNEIKDIEKLAKETFQRGFTILKYGETPFGVKTTERIIEKEVIKEVKVIDDVEIERLKNELLKLKQEDNKITPIKNSDKNNLYDE